MATENDLKLLLNSAASHRGKSLTPQQLNEAVTLLRNRRRVAMVKKADVETIGESVANDRQLFASTDIDDINTVLDSLGK